ncbi:MAG: hypothetical protein EPGJADBJ_03642 [Saprospiraceae bacterium]|nr:hypothetical protein [Saprospiraceae bacterium]
MEEGKLFELEVLKIASFLWPDCENGGPHFIEGRERDGVFVTEDVIHLIEVTISKNESKTNQDVKKLSGLRDHLKAKHPNKLIKCWFITKHEPTPSQNSIAESEGVIAISFLKFQSKLFDAKKYLFRRDRHNFGSVRDPKTEDALKFEDKFVPTEIIEIDNPSPLSISIISDNLARRGERYVMLGHFGVGKSLTCREIYNKLKISFEKGRINKFPIFINLREHDGQTNPSEAIIRHANTIGFDKPESLVAAWKLGYIILILDGLDEMAPLSWADQPTKFKDVRYKTMTLIRNFISGTPSESGILVCGRSNYFDSDEECLNALENGANLKLLKLSDFNEHQISTYLKEKDIKVNIPEWFPTRPLLIAYLVSKGLFQEEITNKDLDAASGWDWLIDKIVEREARLENGVDSKTIREIIEKLASYCRTLLHPLGPVTEEVISNVFYQVCGYYPKSDNRALTMLQRLPGLSAPDQSKEGARNFLDENFVQVAAAGQVFKFIQSPYQRNVDRIDNPRLWKECMGDLGISLLSYMYNKKALGKERVFEALDYAKKYEYNVLAVDILLLINDEDLVFNRKDFTISDVIIPTWYLKDKNLNTITFREVIVQKLIVESFERDFALPVFKESYIVSVIGVHDQKFLPDGKFENCIFDQFDEKKDTNAAILNRDDLSISEKVCITILRKLYFQAGGGRKEKALKSGLSPQQVVYADKVLSLLEKERFAYKSKASPNNRIWIPVRSRSAEVTQIVRSKDKKINLLAKMREIKA